MTRTAPIPRDGPLIVAPTHESFLDPLIVGAYLPRDLSYMARRTLFVKSGDGRERRRRLASALGRWASVIEVDREGGGRDAIRQCLEHLDQGRAVLIFPEGTRSADGCVRDEFQTGVGFLALRSGAPVLPVSIEGSRRVWDRSRKFPRFAAGPVRMTFGAPVRYEKPTRAEDVAADLRRRVLDLRGDGQDADARDGADARGETRGGSSR